MRGYQREVKSSENKDSKKAFKLYEVELREYQKEAINIIDNLERGSYLVQMATGLGKTVTFANIKRKGRVLVLAHREELVMQTIKYYDVPVGIEMAGHKSNGEEVVIASVQSLVRRLNRFKPGDFDMIITDECHHSAAKSYKKIYEYFKPRLHIGFTATPNRGDGARLDSVFEKIIFEKDIRWAIVNKYLCDINCLRVKMGYDVSDVDNKHGDFVISQLTEKMDTNINNKSIAKAYEKYAKGQTIIFATSIEHYENIAKEIKGAVAVTSKTKNREEIIRKFTNREIPVLVNCMIFTEGTDIPLVETIIIARPTTNTSLYIQMVGRGLRLHPNKEKLTLIDMVGVTGRHNICTAPTLLGLDLSNISESSKSTLQGNLLALPEKVEKAADGPESWIKNSYIINLWAKGQSYNLHNVNWFLMPNGDLTLSIKRRKYIIPCQDELGYTTFEGKKVKMQEALKCMYDFLETNFPEDRYIWDLRKINKWSKKPASQKQRDIIYKKLNNYNPSNLNRGEASLILNRVFN